MDKLKEVFVKICSFLKGLVAVLPKRIMLGLIGLLLASISRKFPGLPLPTPEEILIAIGVLVGADTVRELGSGSKVPPVAQAAVDALFKAVEEPKK